MIPGGKTHLTCGLHLWCNGLNKLDVFGVEVRDDIAVILRELLHAFVHKAVGIGLGNAGIAQTADVHIHIALGREKFEGADAHFLHGKIGRVFVVLLGDKKLQAVVNVAIGGHDIEQLLYILRLKVRAGGAAVLQAGGVAADGGSCAFHAGVNAHVLIAAPMNVRVDAAGEDVLAGGVDDGLGLACRAGRQNGGDFAVFDGDVAVNDAHFRDNEFAVANDGVHGVPPCV